MAPICVQCHLTMTRVQNGQPVEEMNEAKPYKLWMADRFECTRCGFEVICDFASAPVAEHHQSDYERMVENFKNVFRFWTRFGEACTFSGTLATERQWQKESEEAK